MSTHRRPIASRASLARLPAALLAVLLGGCSLAPDYRQPTVAIPTSFHALTAPGTALDAGVAVELTPGEKQLLLRFAPDRNLERMLINALQHNPDYGSALRQVQEARAAYRIERGGRLPALAAQLEAKRTRFSNAELAEYDGEKYVVGGVSGEYELDFFGRVESLTQAARARYLGSRYGLAAARSALIAEVLRVYVNERATAQIAEYTRQASDCQYQLHAVAARRFAHGGISRDELNAAGQDEARAKASLDYAVEQHRATTRALHLLLGFAQDYPETTILDLPEPRPSDWQDLDSHVLLDRPDIRQAEAELRARYADIGAARAAFFPSVRLTTAMGSISEGLTGLFKSGTQVWTFAPQVTVPIFSAGRNKAQLNLAELRRDEAVAGYERTVQQAFREAADALGAQPVLNGRAAVLRARAAFLDSRNAAARYRVERGLGDGKDLVADRLEALDARIAHTQAIRDVTLNHLRLLHAFDGISLQTGQHKIDD